MRRLLQLGLLGSSLMAQPPSADAAIGLWPWLVGNVDASVPAILADAQAAGVDTIYLHLWRTTGPSSGTLHMADEAGTWNPALGVLDPDVTLSSFLAQAHAAHLQVVGVVNCFLDGGPLPGDTLHEEHLLQVIDHLVHSFGPSGDPVYRLDGIALDRVRFYTGTGNPHGAVTSFVQRVRACVGRLPLHAFLMANPYTFDGPVYNASFNSYAAAMGTLQGQFGQHWEALASHLDVFLPMAYVAEGGVYGSNHAHMQAYAQTVAQYARQAQANANRQDLRLLLAVRAWSDGTGTTTATSLDACIQGALLGGADGFMPFRYFTMQGQASWWAVVAARTVAGPGLPLAWLTSGPQTGLSFALAAQGSSSLAHPAGSLGAAYDLDDDGGLDTVPAPGGTAAFLAPGPGQHRVVLEVRDPSGRVSVRKRRVAAAAGGLLLDLGVLSTAAGGTRNFSIQVGPGGAGRVHLLVASGTGTSPATLLGPRVWIPLVPDAVTDLVLQLAGSPYLQGSIGILDGAGAAAVQVVVRPGLLPPSLAWSTWHFAAAVFDPAAGTWRAATEARSLLFLP